MNQLNKEYNVPENIHIQLTHLHKGNSSRKQRKGKDYLTIAKFVHDDVVVARAMALCSEKDAPSRKRGRDIAIGRAKKHYQIALDNVLIQD